MIFKHLNKLALLAKVFVFFVFFSYMMMSAFSNLGGVDYLFHIKAGEHIVTEKQIPTQDVFSFTASGQKWVDHEWLYQVVIYIVHKFAGLEALFLLKVLVFSLSFLLLTTFILKTDWVFSFPIIFACLQLSIRRFTLRPDNVSFLFLIIFLAPFIFKKKKLLFFLPIIQIFWVNIHGFFFMGPLILLLYLILGKINKKTYEADFYKKVRLIFLLVILASFITPHPQAALSYPFSIVGQISSGANNIFYDNIQELKSPFSYYPQRSIFVGLLILSALSLCFVKNLNLFYPGLFITFALFSFNALRNIYFFIPIVLTIFANRYEYIKETLEKRVLRESGFKILHLGFLIFTVVFSINLFTELREKPRHIRSYFNKDSEIELRGNFMSLESEVYPENLIEFAKNIDLPDNMFNTFNMGAPLIFNFYPQRKVFIDGRTEVYGQDFFSSYVKASKGDIKVIDELIEKYKLEGFLISYLRDTPQTLIKRLYDKGFICIYFNRDGLIFVDRKQLIKDPSLMEYVVDFSKVKPKALNLIGNLKSHQPSIKGHFNMGYVLYILGQHQGSRDFLNQVLTIRPDHALSYFFLADMLYQEGSYNDAYKYCRKAIFYKQNLGKAQKLMAKIYFKTGFNQDARKILDKYNIDFNKFSQEVNSE